MCPVAPFKSVVFTLALPSSVCLPPPPRLLFSSIQARLGLINDVTLSPPQLEDDQRECARLREASRRLYVQLKEMEKKHREERERLQV